MEITNVVLKANMQIEPEWVEIGELSDGQKVMCKKHIPYADKESLAMSLASTTLYEDEKNEVCYFNYKTPLYETYLFVMAYTNLLVDYEEIPEHAMEFVFDQLVYTGIYEKMMEVIEDDLAYVYEIYDRLCESVKTLFDNSHSLSTRVKKSFSSILDGEDMVDTLAKTEEATASMEELLKAYDKIQSVQAVTDKIPIKDGVLNIGGVKVDLKKKDIE